MSEGRYVRIGGAEYHRRKATAKHVHDGDAMYYGDGVTVMVVSWRRSSMFARIYGPGGTNAFGDPFKYTDYFLPEELNV